MSEDFVDIEKIKEIFGKSTGEKMIEVTNDEYHNLLKEAVRKKLNVIKEEESFNLILENLTIKIVCETEEGDDETW